MDNYDGLFNDPYCYRGTPVLKNKLNIKDYDKFTNEERDITTFSIQNIRYQEPPYNLAYLQTLHKQLFQELYDLQEN